MTTFELDGLDCSVSDLKFGTDSATVVCPIPNTHKRLLDAHELWHQAADHYSDPDRLHTYLNATIQALRNITFVLQNEKHAFDDFASWYSQWQIRMKESSVLVWTKEARNRVVKRADLDTASHATVRLLTWKDDELLSVPIEPTTSSARLLEHLPMLEIIARETDSTCDLSSAVLEVERQWNIPEFHNTEVLGALAVAYGLLSDLVVDAHARLRQMDCIDTTTTHSPFRAVHHRTGILPCMLDISEFQKERFSLATGNQIVVDEVRRKVTEDAVARAKSRYGMPPDAGPKLQPGAEPDSVAKNLVYWAKKMLRKDRYHIRIVFVRDGTGRWHPMGLAPLARSEKHVSIRLLAHFVRKTGADAVIDIGETWLTEVKKHTGAEGNRLESTKRGEGLQVLVATRYGLLRLYHTPFSRGRLGGIKLQDTRISDEKPRSFPYLHPVFKVWAEQSIGRESDGKRYKWRWEPDPLDRCYCGSSGRFGTCCGPTLRGRSMENLEEHAREALRRPDLERAVLFAQAAVAQYVIWMRQHTAPTQHVASDLHGQLVAVDVPAIEAYVRRLDHILQVGGRGAELVPRLRYLSDAVSVPEARDRLIALSTERLYEVGTRAEAAAELDRIENLEATTDSSALRIAAHVFDRDRTECCRLLERARECANNQHDRCAIELDLANEYRRSDRIEEALGIVDVVIRKTREKEELAVPRTAALDLRWRISGSETDFRGARRELEKCDGPEVKKRLLSMLVDHGEWEDAERLLPDRAAGEDVIVELLRIEILLNASQIKEACDLVRKIPADLVAGRLRGRYAYTIGLVALEAEDSELVATATRLLRSIGTEEDGLIGESAKMLEALERVAAN